MQTVLTWATPIAVLIICGIAIAAMAGRMSWALAIGCIFGIAVLFGSPQIVTWIRGMFGV